MSKDYKLKYMIDMFQIPPERFDEFIIDLKKWHKFGSAFHDLAKAIEKVVPNEELPPDYMTMRWIDDGIHDGDVKVKIRATPEEGKS